jgi:hypothetical protein
VARGILLPPRHQIGVPRLDLFFELPNREFRGRARSEIDELPVRRKDIVTVLGSLGRHDALEDDPLRLLDEKPRAFDVVGEEAMSVKVSE